MKFHRLFENPDTVKFYDIKGEYLELEWHDFDAYPFIYYILDQEGDKIISGKMEIGPRGKTHVTIDYQNQKYKDYPKIEGRLWKEEEIISFWEKPSNKENLKKIINALEAETLFKIWNKYRLDLGKNSEGLNTLIPLKDFKKDTEFKKEKRVQHEISPGKKKQKLVPGFGSLNPHQKSLQWKQAMYKSESFLESRQNISKNKNKYKNKNIVMSDKKEFKIIAESLEEHKNNSSVVEESEQLNEAINIEKKLNKIENLEDEKKNEAIKELFKKVFKNILSNPKMGTPIRKAASKTSVDRMKEILQEAAEDSGSTKSLRIKKDEQGEYQLVYYPSHKAEKSISSKFAGGGMKKPGAKSVKKSKK